MQEDILPASGRRDTGWKRDGRIRGIYWRKRANGSKAWAYYGWGKINGAASRQDAIDSKAKAQVDKSIGKPPPNPRVLIRDLAEEVREAKRLKLRSSSFLAFEHGLDKILLPELGHLRVAQVTP